MGSSPARRAKTPAEPQRSGGCFVGALRKMQQCNCRTNRWAKRKSPRARSKPRRKSSSGQHSSLVSSQRLRPCSRAKRWGGKPPLSPKRVYPIGYSMVKRFFRHIPIIALTLVILANTIRRGFDWLSALAVILTLIVLVLEIIQWCGERRPTP